MNRKQTPNDFLKQLLGRPVVVKLNSGVDYRGKLRQRQVAGIRVTVTFGATLSLLGVLACLDGYLNIALEQTEEYVNGQLKQKYGDAFLRGNNGMSAIVRFILNNNSVCLFYCSSVHQYAKA